MADNMSENDNSEHPEKNGEEGNERDEKTPKFVFQCQMCGTCCQHKEDVTIYISDMERWAEDGIIYQVLGDLQIYAEFGVPSIQLKEEKGVCVMYDPEDKKCRIYESRPLTCRAYPLGYDGQHYRVKNKECPGLKAERMTQEELLEIREAAREEQREEKRMLQILPALQTVIIRDVAQKSQESYENLSEEEKAKLKEILGDGQDT